MTLTPGVTEKLARTNLSQLVVKSAAEASLAVKSPPSFCYYLLFVHTHDIVFMCQRPSPQHGAALLLFMLTRSFYLSRWEPTGPSRAH